jgi:plasmid maintenance system killer protein
LEAAENFIRQAVSLYDIANYPHFHFEKLKGDRKDEWSIRLGNTGYRITMYPCDDDEHEIIGGDIISQCKSIKIILVTEVSNHYE